MPSAEIRLLGTGQGGGGQRGDPRGQGRISSPGGYVMNG